MAGETAALMSAIKAALDTDAALQAWVQETFGTGLRVDIGGDSGALPSVYTYPLVVLKDPGQAGKLSDAQGIWNFWLFCMVSDETVETVNNGQVYQAAQHVETLREYCLEAMERAGLGDIDVPEPSGSYDLDRDLVQNHAQVFVTALIDPSRIYNR